MTGTAHTSLPGGFSCQLPHGITEGTSWDRQGSPGCPVRAGLWERGAEGFRVPHSLSDGTTCDALPWHQSRLTPNRATAALSGIRSKQASWGQAGGIQPVCGDTGVCLGSQWLTAASCCFASSKLHAAAGGAAQLSGLYLLSTDSWLAEDVTVPAFLLGRPGLVRTGSSSIISTCSPMGKIPGFTPASTYLHTDSWPQ